MSREALLGCPAMDGNSVSHVRFVEIQDAKFICKLRSDTTLNEHISVTAPDVDAQRQWIGRYKERERSGEEYYFIIRHKMKDCGVVRMYDFKGSSFCWGSWIIQSPRPEGLVTFSAVMIYEIGFDILGFEQSHFDVRLGNQKVIDFHLRSGAKQTERTDHDQHFIFPKLAWPKFREDSKRQIQMHRAIFGNLAQ